MTSHLRRSVLGDASLQPRIVQYLCAEDAYSVGRSMKCAVWMAHYALARLLERDLTLRCTRYTFTLAEESLAEMQKWIFRVPDEVRKLVQCVSLSDLAGSVDVQVLIDWWRLISSAFPHVNALSLSRFEVDLSSVNTEVASARQCFAVLAGNECFRNRLHTLRCYRVSFVVYEGPAMISCETSEFEAMCSTPFKSLKHLEWDCNVGVRSPGSESQRLVRHANAVAAAPFLPTIQSLSLGSLRHGGLANGTSGAVAGGASDPSATEDGKESRRSNHSLGKLVVVLAQRALQLQRVSTRLCSVLDASPWWEALQSHLNGTQGLRLLDIEYIPKNDAEEDVIQLFRSSPIHDSLALSVPCVESVTEGFWDILTDCKWTECTQELSLNRIKPHSDAALRANCPLAFLELPLVKLELSETWFMDTVLLSAFQDSSGAGAPLRKTLRQLVISEDPNFAMHGMNRFALEAVLSAHPWTALEEFVFGTSDQTTKLVYRIEDVLPMVNAPNLRSLTFSGLPASARTAEHVRMHLSTMPNFSKLVEVRLERMSYPKQSAPSSSSWGVTFSPAFEGTEELLPMFASLSATGIRHLCIKDSGLSSDSVKNALAIAKQCGPLSLFSSLETLDLTGNRLCRQGLQALWEGGDVLPNLRVLVVDTNRPLSADAVSEVAQTLQSRAVLPHLNRLSCQSRNPKWNRDANVRCRPDPIVSKVSAAAGAALADHPTFQRIDCVYIK
ncbi:putative mitochondrial protein [Andalucia godoyi]|uniref:Putative mitochondrial protein n=1 Tax=Andalucia godoyi TaxID=505711 RepID=A0A8K0F2K5_ANDGO|nr:putative mitochondrial protein [Andalucia godoyi]|eukprot:ANDGO_05442.mRNA.1 putative mitochondrial protein